MLSVLGVQHLRGGGGGDDLDSSREQAVSAAGTAAQTIFSFSSDKLPQHESASTALMTKSFAKDFEKIAPALTEVTENRKVVVKAVAREAAPLACGDECSKDKVDVLVFLDQARLVGSSKEPTVFANRVSVSMVKTDDGWLVSNIRALYWVSAPACPSVAASAFASSARALRRCHQRSRVSYRPSTSVVGIGGLRCVACSSTGHNGPLSSAPCRSEPANLAASSSREIASYLLRKAK